VAVNVDHRDCGDTDAREVIRRALAAADQTGRPLLVGMQRPTDWSFEDQMALLRPGDVVTYMYRREPHCIIENGRVHPALREARERGILFDVGHGFFSFDFEVAEAAIADGFAPDTISTDSHAMHVGARPAHDLPRTLSKLIAAGMPEADALAAVSVRPARVLGLADEIGKLAPGACADLTVLQRSPDGPPLTDAFGNQRKSCCLQTALTVRAGSIVERVPSGDD